jgi:hypothetical protein
MTKDDLIAKLKECALMGDEERAHSNADDLLLEYINDPAVTEAFDSIDKWYA